jgi:hypothetical protein
MPRFILAALLLLSAFSAVAASAPANDPFAVTLAQQTVAALTGGKPLTDVTLSANVISVSGSDNQSGTATLEAKGTSESRVDLNLSVGTQSNVRNLSNGSAGGAWNKNSGTPTAYAQHNCWTDAAWFFPALSSLTQTANSNFIFKYVGQEQHRGVNTQHIQVFQALTAFLPSQRLSTMDFYLDPVSHLPFAVTFNSHADGNMNVDISNEILFANYQAVSGVQVPFHFQQMFSGSLILDVTVTNVSFNAGLLDSSFNLP